MDGNQENNEDLWWCNVQSVPEVHAQVIRPFTEDTRHKNQDITWFNHFLFGTVTLGDFLLSSGRSKWSSICHKYYDITASFHLFLVPGVNMDDAFVLSHRMQPHKLLTRQHIGDASSRKIPNRSICESKRSPMNLGYREIYCRKVVELDLYDVI